MELLYGYLTSNEFVQNIKRIETETDIELYRAQGASRELNIIVLDLESIVKN